MWQSLGKGLCQAQGRHPCLLICIIGGCGLSECCCTIFFSNDINLRKRDDIDTSTVQTTDSSDLIHWHCFKITIYAMSCLLWFSQGNSQFCRTLLFVCTGLVNICWFNRQQMCCIKQTGIGLSKIPETHILGRVYNTLNAIFHCLGSATTMAHEISKFG